MPSSSGRSTRSFPRARRCGGGRAGRGGRRGDERVHHVPPEASCSRSAGSRSSSARSSSPTRSRSRSRSGRASSRRCARSARRGGRSSASIIVESLVVGIVASRHRALPRAPAREGALLAVRRGRLHAPEHGARLPDADDRRRARSPGSSSRSSRASGRHPRDARAADRRRARGRDAAAGPLRAASRGRRAADDGGRLRRAPLRALRRRPRHDRDPGLDGSRRAAHLPRRRALLVAARAPARARARLAGDADRRRRGLARAGQRAPQPAADGLDCRGADDRARARHARRDARGGDHPLVRGRGQRPLRRRLRDHRAEQLLADPDRCRRGGGEVPGVTAVGNVRTGEALVIGDVQLLDRGRRAAGRGDQPRLGGGLAGRLRAARATTARSSTTDSPRTTASASARRSR